MSKTKIETLIEDLGASIEHVQNLPILKPYPDVVRALALAKEEISGALRILEVVSSEQD